MGAVDQVERDAMERELTRLQSKQAARDKEAREAEATKGWQSQERAKRTAGKKPFYLKDGECLESRGKSVAEICCPSQRRNESLPRRNVYRSCRRTSGNCARWKIARDGRRNAKILHQPHLSGRFEMCCCAGRSRPTMPVGFRLQERRGKTAGFGLLTFFLLLPYFFKL
jgi:hypothetical protein